MCSEIKDWYVACPLCGKPMYVSVTDNGVGRTLHGVHCGWGHDMGHAPTFDTVEELKASEATKGATDAQG